MTLVIERRQAAAPGETVLELRFFRTKKNAEVRAYISCDDVIIDMDMMMLLSRPAAEAFLDALALLRKRASPAYGCMIPLACFRLRLDRRGSSDEPARPIMEDLAPYCPQKRRRRMSGELLRPA
jgi:hypothetical protein